MLVSILQISKILSIFQKKKKKNSKEVNFNRVFFKKNRNEDEHNLHFNRMNQFLNEKHRKNVKLGNVAQDIFFKQ